MINNLNGILKISSTSPTPTMGGIIIIIATLIPVLLFSKLENIYIILLIITMLWMGLIGFADDYIKKFKSDKDGLKGYLKIIGQVILGVFVGSVLYFHPQVTIKDKPQNPNTIVNVVNSEINDLGRDKITKNYNSIC